MEKVKGYYKRLGVFGPVVLSFIFIVIVGLIGFSIFLTGGNLATKEVNLMNADLTRSSILFVLDSTLSAFLVLFPLVIILDILIRYKLKKRAQLKTIAVLGLLLLPSVVIGPMSRPIYNNIEYDGSLGAPLAKYVFIITFDGTRADVFWQVAQFFIDHKNDSVWADHIVCSYPTITYPNHVSLVTGTWPQIHLTQNNPPRTEFGTVRYASLLLRKYHEPVVDDILEIASREGFMTGVFVAPSSMAKIIGGSSAYKSYGEGSQGTMDNVIQYLQNHLSEIKANGFVSLIHLVDSDSMLHSYGVDSSQYRSAISKQANLVKNLYNNLISLGLADESVIIVTADHGGINRQHYNVWPPLVAEIPLWMWGKPFKKGYKLSGGRIVDIAPTVAFILGIPKPDKSIGITFYSALNATIVKSIRGENIDLDAMESKEIDWAIGIVYNEIVLWYIIVVFLIWLLLALVADVLATRKKLKKERKNSPA